MKHIYVRGNVIVSGLPKRRFSGSQFMGIDPLFLGSALARRLTLFEDNRVAGLLVALLHTTGLLGALRGLGVNIHGCDRIRFLQYQWNRRRIAVKTYLHRHRAEPWLLGLS